MAKNATKNKRIQQYLVTETEVHFSPKEHEDGAVRKFVTSDTGYLALSEDKYYSEQCNGEDFQEGGINEWIIDTEIDIDDIEGGADGYSVTYYSYSVKKITHEKAQIYQDIIKQYEKL